MKKSILVVVTSCISLVCFSQNEENDVKPGINKEIVNRIDTRKYIIGLTTPKFSLDSINLQLGDTIEFTNNNSDLSHNIYSLGPSNPFETSALPPGKNVSVGFNEIGETDVECAIHPREKLKIRVGRTYIVKIEAGRFSLGQLPVNVGDALKLVSLDAINHTIYFIVADAELEKMQVDQGVTPIVMFRRPVKMQMKCKLHPSEVLSIEVEGKKKK